MCTYARDPRRSLAGCVPKRPQRGVGSLCAHARRPTGASDRRRGAARALGNPGVFSAAAAGSLARRPPRRHPRSPRPRPPDARDRRTHATRERRPVHSFVVARRPLDRVPRPQPRRVGDRRRPQARTPPDVRVGRSRCRLVTRWQTDSRSRGIALALCSSGPTAETSDCSRGARGLYLHWSRDGRRLSFLTGQEPPLALSTLETVSVATGRVVRSIPHVTPFAKGEFAWAPDGRRVAWTRTSSSPSGTFERSQIRDPVSDTRGSSSGMCVDLSLRISARLAAASV